jgi:ATP-dependent Lon protease
MSVQGNIKPLRSLTEPLQVAKDNGARRALIPIENKRSFLDVSSDIMEHVDPIFYGDAKTAAMTVLGSIYQRWQGATELASPEEVEIQRVAPV